MSKTISKFRQDLGKNISELMDLRGKSRADLAKHLGLNYSSIHRILRGEHSITAETLVTIADFLDGSIYALVTPRKKSDKTP